MVRGSDWNVVEWRNRPASGKRQAQEGALLMAPTETWSAGTLIPTYLSDPRKQYGSINFPRNQEPTWGV